MILRGVFSAPNSTSTYDLQPRSRHGPKGSMPKTYAGINRQRLKIGAGCVFVDDIQVLNLIYGSPAGILGRGNEKGDIVERQKD